MSTLINDTSVHFARPNPFDDPTPWNRVRLAGILIKATAVKFNGFKVEDAWKKQKSKNTSGAVFSFAGTDPVGGEQGFSISFRCVSRDEFDQLYDVYDAIKPLPVSGGTSTGQPGPPGGWTKSAGSPKKPDDASAGDLLKQAQAALDSLNKPTPAASSVDPAAAQTAATTPAPSPGPRPPTVPIELGWLAFLGVFACSRKSFEWTTIEQDNIEVTVGFIHDQPPKPAGAGAQGAPKATAQPGYVGAHEAASKSAKQGATGT